jgi:acetylornithine deacetylase
MDPTISLLCDLIAIDSVNPALVPGGGGEREIAAAIGGVLRAAGLDTEVTEVAPGRFNVTALLETGSPGRTLLLCGHSDTVGVEGMKAPFTPTVKAGRVYGRGAQDMKGGVAAILGAACSLARGGALGRGRLVVAIVADEEHASLGAEEVARRWTADAAVVCEPTDLAVGIGHKGFSWVEVTTRGRAAHGSRPDEGRDAILAMGRVLQGLARLEGSFHGREHPLLGRPSLHASLIAGGRELSTYPDRCTLTFERRTVDGEDPAVALVEVQAILDAELRRDDEPLGEARLVFTRPPYLLPADSELPALLESALGRPAPRCAISFWTDAAILGHAGIPSALFGPGGEGLHGTVEYVRADEVVACRDALERLALAFC